MIVRKVKDAIAEKPIFVIHDDQLNKVTSVSKQPFEDQYILEWLDKMGKEHYGVFGDDDLIFQES